MDRQVPCGRLVLFTMKVWPSPSAYGMTNIMKGLKGTLMSFRGMRSLKSIYWLDAIKFLTGHFRCRELGLFERCEEILPRDSTEAELLKLHTPEMISILKATEDTTDIDSLEELSSKYDFLYIHPVRTNIDLFERMLPDTNLLVLILVIKNCNQNKCL